jgi:uncharacterized protein YjdB
MLTVARRAFAVTLPPLFWACSEPAAPTPIRVTFDRHTATLWASDALATSVSVFKGDEVVANPSVTYASSNPPVASVDNKGRVYAHWAGQATISAAVGSSTDELNVTVLWPPVTDVFFADDSLIASVGDTLDPWIYVLNAKGLWPPNALLTYSSSAPSVATVFGGSRTGEGRIAAVGAGRATITVTVERISDSLLVIVTNR